MPDSRRSSSPLTQADWSGFFAPQTQPTQPVADTTPAPMPPVRPANVTPATVAALQHSTPAMNYPIPPVRPADLTQSFSQDVWNTDPFGTPDSLATFNHMPVIPVGQDNNIPGNVGVSPKFFPPNGSLTPVPLVHPAIIKALLKTHQ